MIKNSPRVGNVIIGRQAEQATLSQVLADASVHRGQALVMRGEAGIGKTTLLEHAAREAAQTRNMRVLRCSGVESEVEPAFSGLHQLLRPVLGHLPALPEAQAEALRGALGVTDSAATELLVSAGVVSLLAEVARERPLLVAADDMQWLDRATAAALVFAARRLGTEPVAMLFAARDPERSTVDTSDLPELWLHGLSPLDAARLLAECGWDLPSRARDSVLAVTGGNPLALTELAALDDRDRLPADIALTGNAPVGDRLRAAFRRRIGTLPHEVRELLVVAAAEETGSTKTVLGAAGRLGLPSDALGIAEREGLIRISGTGILFRHPLVRSAAYAEASFERRSSAHQAIAAELTAGAEPDRAAWHRAVAATAPDEKLATALEHSADAARRRGGEAAAASVLRRAALLSETAESRRDRTVAAAIVALDSGRPDLARELAEEVLAEPVPEVTLTHLIGNIELYSGDPAVAYVHLLRCAELLGANDPEEAAWVLTLAANAAFHAGDLEATQEVSRRIAALDCSAATHTAGRCLIEWGLLTGQELWELPAALARAHPQAGERPWIWATVIGWLGQDQHQARRLARETERRLHASGATAYLTELYYYQATIEYRLGQWDDGVAYAEEGLRFAHETGQRSRIANHLALLAQFAAARGAGEDCRRYAGQALEIALPMRERCAAGVATAALGLLALGEGEPEEAWAHLTRLITPGSPYAHPHTVMTVITDVVEAAVRAGQAKLVLGLLEGIERWVEADPTPTGSAGVHHCRALLAGIDDSAAELHFQHALAAQDVAERPFSRGRTNLLHGEWLRRNQRRVEARIPLRAALEAFERIGAEPWARRAHSELRATGVGVHRAGSTAGLLSAQELEVARLAADGLTNREIGERLVLSPRTVGSHLYRLFPKLGISTRSQLRNLDLG